MQRDQLCSASPSSTSRESAYIYQIFAPWPLPSLFTTSNAFPILQASYFGRTKRCAVHRDALFSSVDTPFTSLFSRLGCPAERDSEGAHLILCRRDPGFQLKGIPLPRIVIIVNWTRLPRDLLYRLMETLNPGRSLRHPEFPPIRRHWKPSCRYIPGHLPDEDSHNRRIFRPPPTQNPFTNEVDGTLFPRIRSWHRSDPVSLGQRSCAQVGERSSRQCP